MYANIFKPDPSTIILSITNFTSKHLDCFVLEQILFKTKQLRILLVNLLKGNMFVERSGFSKWFFVHTKRHASSISRLEVTFFPLLTYTFFLFFYLKLVHNVNTVEQHICFFWKNPSHTGYEAGIFHSMGCGVDLSNKIAQFH